MIKKIKRKIAKSVKDELRKEEILDSLWFKNMNTSEKKIIHIDTPEHGNLGDHMIAIAGNKFFRDEYPNYNLYEITLNEYELIKEELKLKINREDIIAFIGGGHFGNLYLHHEIRRRELVRDYPENKIVFLPATITYEGEEGLRELEKSKRKYENHKDIIIMCREESSYNFAKDNFTNKVVLVPDMVNYLEGDNKKDYKLKQDVLFLLRQDKEKVIEDKIFESLKEELKKESITFSISDTHLGSENVSKGDREVYVNKLLKDIGQSKVVITDRLHGMILGLISKKNVIAFNSLDGKVKKSYDTWYREYKSVVFVDGKEIELLKILKKSLNIKEEKENITKNKIIKIIKKSF